MTPVHIMEVLVRTRDRRILQHVTTAVHPAMPLDEVTLGARDGCAVEEVMGRVYARVLLAQCQVEGDGGVILSVDHSDVSVDPPSQAWRDAQGAAVAHQLQQEADDAALAAALVTLLPADAAQALTRRLGLA